MDTPTPTPPAVASGSPGPGSFQPTLLPPHNPTGQRSTAEERERWKLKARLARARKLAKAGQGAPGEVERIERELSGGSVGSPGPEPVPMPSAPGAVPPVPWDTGLLRPLFDSVVPELEKLAVGNLRAKAAGIDPGLGPLVEKDAAWNPVAKATLVTTGPEVVSKALNSVGVSAEYAPAIAFVTACGAILTSYKILAAKLDEMANAKKAPPVGAPVAVQAPTPTP